MKLKHVENHLDWSQIYSPNQYTVLLMSYTIHRFHDGKGCYVSDPINMRKWVMALSPKEAEIFRELKDGFLERKKYFKIWQQCQRTVRCNICLLFLTLLE